LESIQEKLKELQIEESSLEKQKKNTDNILLRESLNTLNWDNLYQTDFFNTQELLKKSFEGIHKVAKDKVLLHIQKYFKDPSNAEAEDWLYKGTLQNDGINCQFCSQKLNNEAISLLDLYQKIFDNSYIEFEGTIKNELENVLRKLKGSKSTDTTIKIEKNYAAISSYPELLEQDEFKSLFNRFKESSEKIKDLLKKFDLEEKNFLDFLKLNINNKMNLYNTKIDMEYSNEIFNFENNILALIEEFNQVIEKINKLIEDYKSSFTDFTIYNKIKNIKKEITIHSRTLKRVELSEHCEKYKKLEEDIIVLSTSITSLQAELSLEQSQYLADYFVDLNNYFIKFGTKNFVIEKNEDISGHKPIYFLKVKFKNTPIPEKELDLIFSESDRRALALSVFWTNLIRLSPDEKLKTIILLDDAVTSFDENRIMAVHKSLIEIVDSVRQIISLSHYKSEIARFLMTYKEHRHIKLLEISALNDSSSLIISDVNEFIKDEHEKTRDKMLRFINNETNVVEFGDLRIFLEYEIKQRFALQIKEKSISEGMLSDLLKKLKSENIISEIVFKEMDEWRILLNPSHHIWIGADFEDKRTTANSFMDFIYNRLKSI
jgi:wobble nucleotide-excising tRNase